MFIGSMRPDRQRLPVLLAALLLAVLQAAAISHLIGHAASGNSADCELCASAGHAGGALPPTLATAAVFAASAGPRPVLIESQLESLTPAVYRARGPPASL